MVRHGIQQGAPIADQQGAARAGHGRRIALVTSSYPATTDDYAGAFVPGFAAAIASRGCQVIVLTPDKAGPKQAPSTHEVRWFKWSGGSKPLIDLKLSSPSDLASVASLVSSGTRALRELSEEEPIDHCLALWAVPAGYLARRAYRPSVPYSVWALGSDIHTWARWPVIGTIVAQVLRDAACLFADGLELASEVTRISARDCAFMPSTRRLPAPARIPTLPTTRANFLFVGRLEAVKGADVMIEAMLRLLSAKADIYLTICGTGSMEEELRSRVDRAGAAGRIQFMGSKPADVIAGYMAASDCQVIPSRMESIPIVFSEALQAGIPLLMTDVGDMGQLARGNGLAPPVGPGDPQALADAMQSFVADLEGERARSQLARERLLGTFDLQATADRFLAAIGLG